MTRAGIFSRSAPLWPGRSRRPSRPGKTIKLVLPDTEEAAQRADEAESYHIKPTSQVKVGTDGNTYRTYILLRGSSTYDTAEMTRLIDGVMDEAKQMGLTLIWEG